MANVVKTKIVKSDLVIEKKDNITKSFWFLRNYRNLEYEEGLKSAPLRSCLLHNKSHTFSWIIKSKPKWFTDLLQTTLDKETGEIIDTSVYQTNDLTSGNYRKIKAVNKFCDVYEPLYKKHEVSIMFYTLTLANQTDTTIPKLMNAFKMRLKRNGIKLRGYVWVLEISDQLHVHYHMLVATDRIKIKGKKMPEFLKVHDLWQCRTKVEFAQKHVRGYLAKYFVKCSSRILHKRSYGLTMNKTDASNIGKTSIEQSEHSLKSSTISAPTNRYSIDAFEFIQPS
jgi:predicted SprT family Zn-dependent metalloprotease